MSIRGSAFAPGDRWLFLALLVLISWLPVPLGSNRPWSWGLMEVAAFGLLATWPPGCSGRDGALRLRAASCGSTVIFFSCWAFGWAISCYRFFPCRRRLSNS
jgi:hypothetical protein